MEENQKAKYPSHKKWIDFIILYFTTIKEYEEKIEPLRISLNQQNNFSSKSLFKYLDSNSKNFISIDDFIKFMEDNSIKYDEKYLRQFIHNYDKDNDFCIDFQEFKGIILPLTDESFKEKEEKEENEEKLKIKENKEDKKEEKEEKEEEDKKDKINENENKDDNKDEDNNEINTNKNEENKDEKKEENKDEKNEEKNEEDNKDKNKEKIDPNILSIFGEILSEEMGLAEKNMENAKKCLESKFFTFYESFLEIADEDKYITEENLFNFLKKNEIELNEKDMKGLIHRNDTDNDGKISFPEYCEIFYPKSDIKYKRTLNDYNKYQNEYNSILKSGKNKNNNYTFNSPNYYPSRNNNFKTNNNYNNTYSIKNKSYYMPNNYNYKNDINKSPKIRYTSSSLHYDYSTYADEDHDNYSRNKRFRNSSIANLKNSNTIYNNCRERNNYSYLRNCCGCPLSNYFIHYNNCCYCICDSNLF